MILGSKIHTHCPMLNWFRIGFIILSIPSHSLLLSLSHPTISSLKPFLYSLCPGRYILLNIRPWYGVNPMDGNYSFSSKGCKERYLACTTMHLSVIGQTSRFNTSVPFILHLTALRIPTIVQCHLSTILDDGLYGGLLVCKIFNSLNNLVHNLFTNSAPLSE